MRHRQPPLPSPRGPAHPAAGRRSTDARDFQSVPRPVGAMARDLAAGAVLDWHDHPRFQLLYASKGVMSVTTETERWVVPPERAVWLPPGVRHRVVASSDVHMRTLYVRPDAARRMPRRCTVLAVTPLLRQLILRATELPLEYDRRGPAGRVMSLALDELASLVALPYNLPLPRGAPLERLCAELVETPNDRRTLEQLGRAHGASGRTLERQFRARTGMRFSEWRRRARLLRALDWLAQGRAVLAVALDLGYDSPSAFSAMFRREVGVPPTAWRRDRFVTGR